MLLLLFSTKLPSKSSDYLYKLVFFKWRLAIADIRFIGLHFLAKIQYVGQGFCFVEAQELADHLLLNLAVNDSSRVRYILVHCQAVHGLSSSLMILFPGYHKWM